MYPGSSGTVYFAQVTKDPLIEENKCILSNMHMDLESAKPEVRMASSSGNQFSMEFIEVENGGGRKWRIDNSIYEKFDGWVYYGSLWLTLKGLSSQVVEPNHGGDGPEIPDVVRTLDHVHDDNHVHDDTGNGYHDPYQNLGNIYEGSNLNLGNVYEGSNKNLGNIYAGSNENIGNIYEGSNENIGNIYEENVQGQVNNLEDSMDFEETSDAAEPMDSQSNENLVAVHDPKFYLTYKDGASYLKEKKRLTFSELAEKILLESQLAISNPLKDSDQRDAFSSATTIMAQRLKDLKKKWINNCRKLKEKDENKVLFDLVRFNFSFTLKTYSIVT